MKRYLMLMLSVPVLHSSLELNDEFFFLDDSYAKEAVEQATQIIREENWTKAERSSYRERQDAKGIFEGYSNARDDRLYNKLCRKASTTPPVRSPLFLKPLPSSGMRPIEYLTYFCRQRPVHASFTFIQILLKTMQTWILWRVWFECCQAFQGNSASDPFRWITRLLPDGADKTVIHYLMMGGFPLLCGYIPSLMIMLLAPDDKWMEYWFFAGLRFAFEFIFQQNIPKELEVLIKEQVANRPISQIFQKTVRFFLKYGESTDLLKAIYEMPEQIFESFKVGKELIHLITSISSNIIVRSLYDRKSSIDGDNSLFDLNSLIFANCPGAAVAISFGFVLFAIFCIYNTFSKSIFDAEKKCMLLTECGNKNITETMNNIMLVLSSDNFGIEFTRFLEYLKYETQTRAHLDRLKTQMTVMASATAASFLILDLFLRYFTVVGRRDFNEMKNLFGKIRDQNRPLPISSIMEQLKDPSSQCPYIRPIFSVASSISMDLIAIVQLFILINLIVNQSSDIFKKLSISKQMVENPDIERDGSMDIAPRDKYKNPQNDPRGAIKIMIGAPGAQYLTPEEEREIRIKAEKIYREMEENQTEK